MKTECIVAIALAVASCGAFAEQVLFEEKFDNFGVKAPIFHESCEVYEWPPSLKQLNFDPKQPAQMFRDSVRVAKGAAGWKDYLLRFKFKFIGNTTKHFDLQLLIGDKTLSIGYAHEFSINAPGCKAPPEKNQLLEPLLKDVFYEGRIRVQGTTLEAFLFDGKLFKLAAIEIPAEPTRGFNISTDTRVLFEYFRVTDLPGEAGLVPPPYVEPAGAAQTGVRTLAMEGKANTASAAVKVGATKKLQIALQWQDGSSTAIKVASGDQSWEKVVLKDDKQAKVNEKLLDSHLDFSEQSKAGFRCVRYFRPEVQHFEDLELAEIAKNWDAFPAASETFFDFEARQDNAGVEIWIDGRYAGRKDNAQRLKALVFELGAGGATKNEFTGAVERSKRFLPLNAAAIANPGNMKSAKPSVTPGAQIVEGVLFRVVDGAQNVDVGVVKEHRGSWALECDLYLARTAFSGIADTLRISVPTAQYIRAYALCAVEDDPNKLPVLTARLTRFLPGSIVGRGPAIASTTVTLPRAGQAPGEDVKKVGEVSLDGKTTPLYLVEIPIDVGSIQDVLFQEKDCKSRLDFDLIGKPRQSTQQLYMASKPDPFSISGVHVFGVTLECSPVEMVIMPAQTGNVYYPNEKPGMTATLRPREPGDYTLSWKVSDIKGNKLDEQKEKFVFAAAEGEKKVEIAFSQKTFGWYKVDFTLTGPDHRAVMSHVASFVLQPPNTRKAEYDSPFYTWWFAGAHGTNPDIKVIGPLLERAGIRRTQVRDEKDGAQWKLTGSFIQAPENLYDEKKPDKGLAAILKGIEEKHAKLPHVTDAMIFHESCSGPYPLELIDLDPQLSQAAIDGDKRKSATALFIAQALREKMPGAKLCIGNTGNSVGGIVRLLRSKYPAEFIDYIGEESVGQTIPPEKNEEIGGTAYCFWILRQLALKFGYDKLMPAACYERNYRSNRTLGPAKAAAWTVRDALIVMAWGSPLVPIMGPEDCSYSYANGVWGDFGMFTRYPQTYPHPGFAAMATLTQQLDRVKFQQQLATGSPTAYALEFARGDENVYAAWVARGTAEMSFEFDRDEPVRVTDLWGASVDQRIADKKLALKVSGEVVYLATAAKVKSVSVGKREFPDDAPPAHVVVASKMDNSAEWELITAADSRVDNPGKPNAYPPFMQPGKFELRQVKDDERGECLELGLLQEGKVPAIMREYAMLKLKTPAPVAGTPKTLGVWIKGNSGWGQLMWEYEDAEGEKWLSCGTGGYGCNIYDWPGQASINFDGWNFLQFPMTQDSPVSVPGPGGVLNEWQSDGRGNRKLDYPIKLTGILVNMQRGAINLTKMDPVKTVIRLKDLSAY